MIKHGPGCQVFLDNAEIAASDDIAPGVVCIVQGEFQDMSYIPGRWDFVSAPSAWTWRGGGQWVFARSKSRTFRRKSHFRVDKNH